MDCLEVNHLHSFLQPPATSPRTEGISHRITVFDIVTDIL